MPGAVLKARDNGPVLRHLLASGRYRQTNESIIWWPVTLSTGKKNEASLRRKRGSAWDWAPEEGLSEWVDVWVEYWMEEEKKRIPGMGAKKCQGPEVGASVIEPHKSKEAGKLEARVWGRVGAMRLDFILCHWLWPIRPTVIRPGWLALQSMGKEHDLMAH